MRTTPPQEQLEAPAATYDVCGPAFAHIWTRLVAPTRSHPYWADESGTQYALPTILVGLPATQATAIREAHIAAITDIATAALAATDAGEHRDVLRLANAAGRLCEEIAGFWPVSLRQSRNGH